jgi:HD superfamily phosphohydrolase
MKKYKLLMDPVYDEFIMVERGGVLEKILDSFHLQRLRYIRQLGPCYHVYPGAEHTRFQHSIGVMWLARKALNFLKLKDYQIDEFLSTSILVAALTHDLGHSPFSHALEGVIIPQRHEELTLYALKSLSEETNIEKDLIDNVKKILSKKHPLPFSYQLISSQLDCDRLDYLRRDAFYTGVSFGKIDVNRILVSVLVEDGELIWSSKGFNALEAYVMSRYEMYWAVYFHKVNLSVQVLLKKIVERIKELLLEGNSLQMDHTLSEVLKEENVEKFFRLTDGNVISSIYSLMDSRDSILSDLCKRLVKRNFFRTVEVTPLEVLQYRELVEKAGFDPRFYFEVIEPSKVAYSYYSPSGMDIIKVKVEDRIEELSNVAPTDALKALSRKVSKVYVVIPEEIL